MELRVASNAVEQSSYQLRSQGKTLCREAKEKGHRKTPSLYFKAKSKPSNCPPDVSIDWGLLVEVSGI